MIANTTGLMPGEKPRYGTEVAPRLNAPVPPAHLQPLGSDMSVDGDANSVYEVNTRGLPRGEENPHGNAFVAESTPC